MLSALATQVSEKDAIPAPTTPQPSQDPATAATLAHTLFNLLVKPHAHQGQPQQNPTPAPASSNGNQHQHFTRFLPALIRIGYKAWGIPSSDKHTIMSKVDHLVAPIVRTELPTVSLSPQHPKYLWYIVPALAYLAIQGKLDDLQITSIISLLVPRWSST